MNWPVLFRDQAVPVLRLDAALGLSEGGERAQIVVARTADGNVGIMVDALRELHEVAADQVDTSGHWLKGLHASCVKGVVKPADHRDTSEMLVILEPEKLLSNLGVSKRATVESASPR